MALFLAPFGNSQAIDANGAPLVGGSWRTFLAGTTTPVTTYTSQAGTTPQGSVMTLDSLGLPVNGPVWMTSGISLKFSLYNSAGVLIDEWDNISGIGDATSIDEWVLYPAIATRTGTTSFSVVGDQTNTFQVNRRLKINGTFGISYSTISTSGFSAGITTVVVVLVNNISLGIGAITVSYSLLSVINSSVPNTYILPGYIFGCTLSTAGASTTMTVATGRATDTIGVQLIQLTSSFNKTTGAWVAGSGQGGLDTGTIAITTWYHFYLIRRADTGAVDVLFSTSTVSPSLPSGYSQYRGIGSGYINASSQWEVFIQDGDEFSWGTPSLDITATNPGTAAILRTVKTPIAKRVLSNLRIVTQNPAAGGAVYTLTSDPSATDVAPIASNLDLAQVFGGAGGVSQTGGRVRVFTNTASQVRHRISYSDASVTTYIYTLGWTDTRGRNA
jgi:hypothetical protein